MSRFIPISQAPTDLLALVEQIVDHDITLTNHGRPTAVLLSAERYEALLEEIEDLKDRLSVHERDGVTVPLDHLAAELGFENDDLPRSDTPQQPRP